jgi:hypothetical protein
MPTPYHKIDKHSTYFKGSKPSFEISDPALAIENLQPENFQLLQQLEERKTLDTHIHHDNAILQSKVNSLQWLVDEMKKTNHNLRAQLKQHNTHKTKSSRQEGEASKVDPSQQA